MRQKKILLVEDNEFNRKIVRDLLARQPYHLLEAHDGEAGVAAARRDKPDVIVMDVKLHKLSGLEATRAIRAETETAKKPIIVVTSFATTRNDKNELAAAASTL